MYNPVANRVSDDDAFDLIEAVAIAHLVSHGEAGLECTSLPLLGDRSARRLRGHLARANDQWRTLDGVDVLAVFSTAADGYVSPAWYPSKAAEGGRVVPTWNYEVVQVRGVARVHHDAAWKLTLVDDLTVRHEAARSDGGEVWSVSDAPSDFLDRQLRAVVGVSVEITSIDGKRKLSQNRSDADRRGVIDALDHTSGQQAPILAAAMRDAMDRNQSESVD